MKERFKAILVCLSATGCVLAQVNVTGSVLEKAGKEAVAGASVVIKDGNGKIRKFGSTGADGGFNLNVASTEGCTLNVSMMGFARQSIPLDSIELPVTVYLDEGSTLLKEVSVKAESIREQGDTLIYNVGSFAQSQDRSIGDVLNRMPGITVEDSGRILYQGEDINKFYIEGSDLMGGKYGVAANGISHEDVGAVEVMEHHQPLQVLSGLAYSDKAALNLKLKNKAKATWTFNGEAGGGYSQQPEGMLWKGNLFAMAVMPGFQSLTTLTTNNIGKDLETMTRDFLASGKSTELRNSVSLSLPGVPALGRHRTLFNRSVLLSTSNLWKFKRGQFKTQIDYIFNRTSSESANITTYYLTDGDRVITEQRNGIDRKHSLSGKFAYELNQKTAYINNTLSTELNWDDINLSTTGSITNSQSATLPDYYIGNNFKLIKRFGGKHLVTFKSLNEWESLPQNLRVNAGNSLASQKIRDHAFITQENAAYSFVIKGVTVSLEGGIKGYFRSFRSELPELPETLPGETTNVMSTNYLTIFINPRFEYWLKRVNLGLDFPLNFSHYSFDKVLANRDECYFSPNLSINWQPNNNFTLNMTGGIGRSPMDLNLIRPGLIMNDYRSFSRGVDNFYSTDSRRLSAYFSYRQTRIGIFTNGRITQTWGETPYTMTQQLFGDYVVNSYSDAKNSSNTTMAYATIGQRLDFMRGSIQLHGSFSRNVSNLISENRDVNSITTSWTAGLSIDGTPIKWLSFDYRLNYSSTRLAMNRTNAPWLTGMTNDISLNIFPHRKWKWQIGGEHYRNEIETDNFKNVFLLDTKLTYKPTRRLEICAMLNNILDTRTYSYTSYNQLSSFESQRWLRGREFLVSIILNK